MSGGERHFGSSSASSSNGWRVSVTRVSCMDSLGVDETATRRTTLNHRDEFGGKKALNTETVSDDNGRVLPFERYMWPGSDVGEGIDRPRGV